MASFVHKTDFGYFVAIVAPDAEEDELRIMFDWGNWVRIPCFLPIVYADFAQGLSL